MIALGALPVAQFPDIVPPQVGVSASYPGASAAAVEESVARWARIEAARALGIPDPRVIVRHVLPNCLSPVIVQGTFVFAAAVLGEAALSFLGLGVPPQVPSLGNVLAEGRLYLHQAPWLTLFPGAAIMAVILGLNLFGDGLRDLLDPKLRSEGVEKLSGPASGR